MMPLQGCTGTVRAWRGAAWGAEEGKGIRDAGAVFV